MIFCVQSSYVFAVSCYKEETQGNFNQCKDLKDSPIQVKVNCVSGSKELLLLYLAVPVECHTLRDII